MQIPSRAELERFFGEDRAKEVQFLETVAAWPSLRILEYLYTNEPATTGDVARGINMDMRDVRDRLEALENHEIVTQEGDSWHTRTNSIEMTITQGENQLEISHTIESSSEPVEESSEGVITRLSRLLNPFQ
ncbi:helix-turn-helix domain-containing protein [Natronomonas gomsonensis]|jgi:DNA-binding Lrp family transcriptional regulator|nr:helix-turn-helix domain-containing protein [Natronomonas gomsonensis]